jgi:hypothetical protein
MDGRLDEPIYTDETPVATGLIQAEPNAGEPSTEKTEAWIFFDDENVYLSFRCWESHPERMIVNELRRDNFNIANNEHISFGLDTFHDRRNAVVFAITPAAARMDGEVANERQYNGDWNPVWTAKTGRFDGGWTVETAIPFKSLRYAPGRDQIWGFNFRRGIRWKNELAYLTPIPASQAQSGLFMWSLAATLDGIQAPEHTRRLEVRPYAATSLTTDRMARPTIANELSGDVGGEAKIGLTQNLSADLTVNTDFAQVEADEQQINLTRFSLFFPEKRDFFLENQGLFAFGGTGGLTGGSGGDTPTMFYSRRIGLSRGRAIPIRAGGRVTGRLGRFSVGALTIQADDDRESQTPVTNFSVVRIKRDVLRRSSVGILGTYRSVSEHAAGESTMYGVDGTFSFFDNLAIDTYWAQTRTDTDERDNTSYRAQLAYTGDRYGVQAERLTVGTAFDPEIGFARRRDIHKSRGLFRFSPRPQEARLVRKYTFQTQVSFIETGSGRLDTRQIDGSFGIEFQNSDRLSVSAVSSYEFLEDPFPITSGIQVSRGGYDYASGHIGWTFGQQRRASGTIGFDAGSFYNGNRTVLAIGGGRVELARRVSLQPTVSWNRVTLPQGSFTATLVGSRATFTMTPAMFVSALVQYNSSANLLSANVRLRWEYQPGSELFVVYSDQRDTLDSRFADLANRAIILKINKLVRF